MFQRLLSGRFQGTVNYCCFRQAHDSGQLNSWMHWREYVGYDQFWYDELESTREDIKRQRQLHYSHVPFSGYALFHIEAHLQGDRIQFLNKEKSESFHKRSTIGDLIDYRPSERLEVAYKVLPRGENDNFDLLCAVFFGYSSDLSRIFNAPNFTASADTLSRCLAFAAFNGADKIVELLLQVNASAEPMFEYTVEPMDYLRYSTKRNCLGLAMYRGHSSTAKCLLDLRPELADSPVYASFDGYHTLKNKTALEDLISKMEYSSTNRSEEWQDIKIELQKRAQRKSERELDVIGKE